MLKQMNSTGVMLNGTFRWFLWDWSSVPMSWSDYGSPRLGRANPSQRWNWF